MKLPCATAMLAILLAGCGKVEDLRLPARANAPPGTAGQQPVAISEVPGTPPEARPDTRNPFNEPDRPRREDKFDLPPT
jgi:predicted small lipoprotein YifL